MGLIEPISEKRYPFADDDRDTVASTSSAVAPLPTLMCFIISVTIRRATVVLVLVGLSIAQSVSAESLQWERRIIETSAAPHDIVKVAFRFTNIGAKPVTLLSVVPNCDCTTAQLKKNTFGAGEQGQIDVAFDVADSRGPQYKTITVTTDENPSEEMELLLKVKLPAPIEITPRLLSWQVGDAAAEKSLDITLSSEPATTVTSVKSRDSEMETRLETLAPNRHYRVFVKPNSTVRPHRSTLVVTTITLGGTTSESNVVYAQIR
jgi:hypothetical protein